MLRTDDDYPSHKRDYFCVQNLADRSEKKRKVQDGVLRIRIEKDRRTKPNTKKNIL